MAIVTLTDNMEPRNKVMENDNTIRIYGFSPKVLIQKDSEQITPVGQNDSQSASFQGAMKMCIIIGQCFGLNPVLGVCEKDPSKLRFTLYSARFLYAVASILGQSWFVCLCMLRLAKEVNPTLGSNSNIAFYGTNTISTILFLRIAAKWPKLCQQIAKIEAVDPHLDAGIVKKCNISCIIVLSLALTEHLLSVMSALVIANDCQPNTSLIEAFHLQSFTSVWTFFYYSKGLGFYSMFINIQCTFNWNFADVFVICISWYLTSRLKQVNNRIVAARGKYVSASFWRTMREEYCKATNLVRKVDDVISSIIFISFANNLFFVCLQFLHILEEGVKPVGACGKPLETRPLKGFEHVVYFLFSFGFLLVRSISVSLIAARVHTASKEPAQTLYDVPSASYCIEVQRFIDQVHGDNVALSGLQFFHVKRGLLLTVAGTIVTYELVLMQFTGVTPTTSPSGPLLNLPLSTKATVNTT